VRRLCGAVWRCANWWQLSGAMVLGNCCFYVLAFGFAAFGFAAEEKRR
jgi:hypothetical protein